MMRVALLPVVRCKTCVNEYVPSRLDTWRCCETCRDRFARMKELQAQQRREQHRRPDNRRT